MFQRLSPLLAACFAAGCVAYEADPTDVATVAAEARLHPGGTFTLAEAIATALRQNPELLALEARARAAGAVTEPIEVEAEYRSELESVAVLLDPIALLGLGARGAAIDVNEAEARAAVADLAVARWRTAAAVAEEFALASQLESLRVPQVGVDVDAFERAGLAAPAVAQRLRAAQAAAHAEDLALLLERERWLSRLRTLLGLAPGTEVTLRLPAEPVVAQPPADLDAVLSRPDLALALARLHVADAEFRRAVADQYPSIVLGPEIPLRGGMLEAMAVLRLPIGMAGRAEAARERREAARAELAAAWVRAGNEAHTADQELAAAESAASAAASAAEAHAQLLTVAVAGLEVEVDGFDRAAELAGMAVTTATERRKAVAEQVRARVARAVAFGWPFVGGAS